ncbi:hypothetical protein [Desulfallas thermosapovorans]|uniref:DUF5671 domain-containing protein n=1 Tax=Desulfallas thermosapovorans DSM 6562 TaxID=1121431 RepID=A0A5S4ZVD0_9FIRM|nr:hypothetical protein [Desulfallas thermosapovorans]TYO96882.1 hypothetical protein LX24_00692 [Desulfallas thermosapovorans DSM 6562]
MVFPLLIVAAILVVVIIVVLVVVVKNETEKGGRDVIKNVYIYLVLFATLMMTIGGSVGAFMAVADIVSPVPYYQTFEEFKRLETEKPRTDTSAPEREITLSEEELRQQYDAMVLMEKERQINRAKNSLIKSFGWIIIPLPVFVYFQRQLVNKDN